MNAYLVTWFVKNHQFKSIVLAANAAEAHRIIKDEYSEGRELYINVHGILPAGLVYTVAHGLADVDSGSLTTTDLEV